MWYSRIKTAISKQTAEDIIQGELRSGSYVDPSTEDADTIKRKLVEKYGSEEAMLEAINEFEVGFQLERADQGEQLREDFK